MRRFLVLLGVLALALSTAGVASALAGFTITLSINPAAAVNGDTVTLSGVYQNSGVGVAGANVSFKRWTNGTCSGTPEVSGFVATTNGAGAYSFSGTLALTPGTTYSFQTSAGSGETLAVSSCATLIVLVSRPVSPPQENFTFLCYSKFEQDSGMVFNVKQYNARLAEGYWKPFAVKSAAPSPLYTTAGAYYLTCNPSASMKPTGFGVDLSGLDLYPYSPPWSDAATIFSIVQ